MLAVNLSSVFRLCRGAGRHMLERGGGGKIINIASLLSFQGGVTVPGYAAAKGGVMQLTKALANEWAARAHQRQRHRARATWRPTTPWRCAQDATRSRQIGERIPAGRWGTPQDLAGAVDLSRLAAPPTTCTATCSSSTAAGWAAEGVADADSRCRRTRRAGTTTRRDCRSWTSSRSWLGRPR